jgi:alpha-amylase/alpha-mannosidase (GH57 family)
VNTTPLVIHGHFYQPPRENPWTGRVDREPTAYPFHDWNERILSECYRANAFARIFGEGGRVERVVNNYAHVSFNFGPTLFSWLEGRDPTVYARILAADRESARGHGGHGNAIAQGYNHTILPLMDERDRRTQVRWGLADFHHRFGRAAEALWLPETACDDATLGTLIDAELRYAILAPQQAARVRRLGVPDAPWRDVAGGTVDPRRAYRYFHRDGSGRSLALFFYDGKLAHDVAFGGALATSQAMVARFALARDGAPAAAGPGATPGAAATPLPPGAPAPPIAAPGLLPVVPPPAASLAVDATGLVHLATDGESYGHHARFGDLTLAYALAVEVGRRGFEVTNYAEYLDGHAPEYEAEILPGPDGLGTSWSCAHGVGRWFRDCGCHTGGQPGWTQAWRTPLRAAMDVVREAAHAQLEAAGGSLLRDPWAARDDAVELALEGRKAHERFFAQHAARALADDERRRVLTLLELARAVQYQYTSCGWFFSDISGLEAVQVMKYAGRALDLLKTLGAPPPRGRFLEALSQARSNVPGMGNGADIFRAFVEPLAPRGTLT